MCLVESYIQHQIQLENVNIQMELHNETFSTNFTHPFADCTDCFAYFTDPWAKLKNNILISQTYLPIS